MTLFVAVTAILLIYGQHQQNIRKGTEQEPAPIENAGGGDRNQSESGENQNDDTTANNGANGKNGADETDDTTNGTGNGNGSLIDGIDRDQIYDENGIIKPEYAEMIIKVTADKVILVLKTKTPRASQTLSTRSKACGSPLYFC